jgi:TonB-dependent SusC/RagA subfamily outer membrane receptor
MENFLFYLLKSGIWIMAFWSIYWFFLRKEIFFRFNRFFLLAGLPVSLALAFCQYRYSVMIQRSVVYATNHSIEQAVQPIASSFNWVAFVAGVYVLIVLALIVNYLIGLNKIRRIIQKQKTKPTEKPPVVDVEGIQSSFSAFGYVFMDTTSLFSEEEKRLIIEHENAHIEQGHWVDLFLVQAVCILQWFNPFIWLYRNAIKQNHEFLADRSVLQKGNSPAIYHATLINYTFRAPVFALTNSFTYYKFKRINMMKKNVSKPAKKLAVLLLVPALAIFLWAFAKPEYRYSTVDFPEKDIAVQDTVPQNGAPLLIVNGKEKAYNPALLNFESATEEEFAAVIGVKADDIEEITVFKEAASTAIYGARGKNGVLLIKVKKHPEPIAEAPQDGSPLIVVDGRVVNYSSFNFETATEDDFAAVIGVKADDIEEITVFKDSASIAIWGDSGKNGVLMVKTKAKTTAPKKEEKFTINLDNDPNPPLFIVDDKEIPSSEIKNINSDNIESMDVLKNKSATEIYGEKGKNGVVIIKTKK